MNINLDLIIQILESSILVSCFTTAIVQKTKGIVPKKNLVGAYSFLVNVLIGTLFMLSFSDSNLYNALWVGVLSFVGADSIYRALEEKGIVKKYNDIKTSTTIEVPKENIIERSDV